MCLAFLLRYCVLVSFYLVLIVRSFTPHVFLSFRSAHQTIHHSFLSIHNCRHFYCLIEMAIMQCFNGQWPELTNTHFFLLHSRTTNEIKTIVTISFKRNYFRRRVHFSIFFRLACQLRSAIKIAMHKKHICQSERNIIT